MFSFNHKQNCGSKTLFYRTCMNCEPRRPEIPNGCLGPHVRLQFTRRCNNPSRKVTHMSTRRAREQHSCIVSDIFVCAFAHISQVCVSHPCQAYMSAVPPLLHSRRSPNNFGMEFTSNNLRLHVSTAGDIIATLRFVRFRAAPKHGLRPQTLQSAPGPFSEQCSLFGPNGKMFGVSFWASASTQNLATRAFDINSPQLNLLRDDSMSLKGHRHLVKDAEWCHPAYRKFEGAHPRKGKAKSTEHKAERYWQVRSRSKKNEELHKGACNELMAEAGFASSCAASLVLLTPAWDAR